MPLMSCANESLMGQCFNDVPVLWKLRDEPFACPEFEVGEFKTRCDRTTDQRKGVWRRHPRPEPTPRWHDALRMLRPDFQDAVVSVRVDDVHVQRCARVEVPDFVGADAVQRGNLSAFEEKVDRRGMATPVRTFASRAVRLTEKPALRMRLEVQRRNPVLRCLLSSVLCPLSSPVRSASSTCCISSGTGAVNSTRAPLPG